MPINTKLGGVVTYCERFALKAARPFHHVTNVRSRGNMKNLHSTLKILITTKLD